MEKVSELEREKMKTGKAYHDFLPSGIVKDLKKRKVAASQFSCVTIFYGEILDFDDLTKDCSASEVCISNLFLTLFSSSLPGSFWNLSIFSTPTWTPR